MQRVNKLSKGDIVKLQNKPDTLTVCVIDKGGVNSQLIFENENGELRVFKNINPQIHKVYSATSEELTPKLKERLSKNSLKLKKGQPVSFEREGKTVLGVVEKGGARPTVVFDNGTMQISGSASLFTPVNPSEMPKDEPSDMDKWAVVSYKEHKQMSEETIAFNATVTLNGKKVFDVSNRGHGGCMDKYYVGKDKTKFKEIDELWEKNLLSWAKQNGMTWEAFELDEEWVLWFTREKPLFITAKQHFDKDRKWREEIGLNT